MRSSFMLQREVWQENIDGQHLRPFVLAILLDGKIVSSIFPPKDCVVQ